MAPSSFAPMRRLKISSLPASTSKRQFPSCFTSGMGKGQPSAPSCSSCLESDAATRLIFSLTRLMKSSCSSAASTTSTETKAWPAGPKIACKALVSLASTAALRASTAAWGELNRASPAASSRPCGNNRRQVSTRVSQALVDTGRGEQVRSFIDYYSFAKLLLGQGISVCRCWLGGSEPPNALVLTNGRQAPLVGIESAGGWPGPGC